MRRFTEKHPDLREGINKLQDLCQAFFLPRTPKEKTIPSFLLEIEKKGSLTEKGTLYFGDLLKEYFPQPT